MCTTNQANSETALMGFGPPRTNRPRYFEKSILDESIKRARRRLSTLMELAEMPGSEGQNGR